MFPLFGPVGQSDPFWDALARAFRTIVWGPPAVIAFFLISGFCIHYPFAASNRKCPILRFYLRRYIRILAPVFCIVILFKVIFPEKVVIGHNTILWQSTLWSLACEEIYYAAYPLLNRCAPRFGWLNVVKVAFAVSILTCWWFYPGPDWQDIGLVATAVTLFPVWLMGCYLADNPTPIRGQCSSRQIWFWRITAWAVMWLAMLLHFHAGIYQTITGLWVGLVYYFWLKAEIGYFEVRIPWKALIWAGGSSYSLYLVHPIAIDLCWNYGIFASRSRLEWLIVIALVFFGSYVFYRLVERPSHTLARRIPLFGPKGAAKHILVDTN